ncbi:hypothetical protein HZC09_04740 [Candidatus Micrarchaeota archaeon]|nr:hypothetical protein [Candidatus Micrarchaeota archaeon]
MKLVLDSTPIIHCAKTRLHSLLEKLDVELLTTPLVRREVSGDFAESPVIERLFKEKIRVVPNRTLLKSRGLHDGEASCITLAEEKDAVLVCDDRVGRAVAKAKGLKVVHSTFFLFRALEKRAITRREAEDLLEELTASGWHCDSETLARLYNALRNYG